jgi:hypothetical protein
MQMNRSLFLAALLAAAALLVAQAPPNDKAGDAKAVLERGIDLFGQERYRDALDAFGKVLSDPKAQAERPEAAHRSR